MDGGQILLRSGQQGKVQQVFRGGGFQRARQGDQNPPVLLLISLKSI
jgi:hypothetical protein